MSERMATNTAPADLPRPQGPARAEHTNRVFGSHKGTYVWLEAVDAPDAFIVQPRRVPRPGTLIAIPLLFAAIAVCVFYLTGWMEQQQPRSRGAVQIVGTGIAVLSGLAVLLIQIMIQFGAHADGPLLLFDKKHRHVTLPRYKITIERGDVLAVETLIAPVPEGHSSGRVSLNHNALALIARTSRGEESWMIALYPGYRRGTQGLASEIARALDLPVKHGLRNPTTRYICWHCRYSLAGLEPDNNEFRCPECGGKTPRIQ